MAMGMHTKDIILPRETLTDMAMSAKRHPVRVATPIAHNDGLKAVDTMIDQIRRTSSTTRVTLNMTMSNTMNHGRHEGAARITCQTCLMVRSRR